MKKKKNKFTFLLLILDILAISCLVLAYGPFDFFRSFVVTTGMATQSHQYLVYTLYNDKMIDEVMNKNFVGKFKGNSDVDDIEFIDPALTTHYSSQYEEAVLKKDTGNDLYKIININYENADGHKMNGYIAVIYDPSRISLITSRYNSRGGQKLSTLCRTEKGIVCVNAGGFRYTSAPSVVEAGTVIQNGKITSIGGATGYGNGFLGFDYNNKLMLSNDDADTVIANGMKDGLTFGPFLIMNGESALIEGNGGWGYAPRTAIAQRKDGIVLFLVIDGRTTDSGWGASLLDMRDILLLYGAYNASNLDGGGSSSMVVNNELINQPISNGKRVERSLPNAWVIK